MLLAQRWTVRLYIEYFHIHISMQVARDAMKFIQIQVARCQDKKNLEA